MKLDEMEFVVTWNGEHLKVVRCSNGKQIDTKSGLEGEAVLQALLNVAQGYFAEGDNEYMNE